MEDLFARQESARRASHRLLGLLACATALLAALAGLGSVVGLRYLEWSRPSLEVHAATRWWTFALATAAVSSAVLMSSLSRVRRLRIGGAALADEIGARPCDTVSLLEARFVHIIEEVSIAAGIDPPAAYVLDQEHGINACSLGWETRDCVICVSMGALRRLERAALQGVVAHEIAHIANGDTGLRIRVLGWTHGLQALALIGRRLVFPAWRAGDGAQNEFPMMFMPVLFAGAVLNAVGWLGWGLGLVIRAAVARERESLADAAALQYTRDPQGMAAALKTIGGFPLGSRLVSRRLDPIRHLFIAAAAIQPMPMLRSHPELAERIRVLDPQWDGAFPPSHLVSLAYDDALTRDGPRAAGIPPAVARSAATPA